MARISILRYVWFRLVDGSELLRFWESFVWEKLTCNLGTLPV